MVFASTICAAEGVASILGIVVAVLAVVVFELWLSRKHWKEGRLFAEDGCETRRQHINELYEQIKKEREQRDENHENTRKRNNILAVQHAQMQSAQAKLLGDRHDFMRQLEHILSTLNGGYEVKISTTGGKRVN